MIGPGLVERNLDLIRLHTGYVSDEDGAFILRGSPVRLFGIA